MPKLSEPQKRFIVGRLACFYTPSEVVEQVKEELGVAVTRQQVMCYDPTCVNGRDLSQPLKDLFNEARKQFNDDITSIPIANRAYRLRKLQDLVQKNPRNADLQARLLEQAAKETGGAFTNRRELTGKDGGPVETVTLTSAEQKRLEELRAKANAPNGGGTGGV